MNLKDHKWNGPIFTRRICYSLYHTSGENKLIHNNNTEGVRADFSRTSLGNYELIRSLGHGGFASVYLGKHRYLKRLAAIKVLRTLLAEQEKGHFQKEAQLLANLSHPHIVRVFEFSVATRWITVQDGLIAENTPYLVMDYITGGNLRTRYPMGTRLPLTTVITYIEQVAQALHYAHNHHVIHRDIKPENLLLNERGEVMLSDFGLALLAPRPDFLSQQGIAGTPAYIAPEQLRGKPVFASDQYSLAIIAYEWLSGRLPFRGMDLEVMMGHISFPPPPLRMLNPSIPQPVEKVIMKALAKEPQQRYQSISDFARALELAASQHSPSFAQASPTTEIPEVREDVHPYFSSSSQNLVSPSIKQNAHFRPRSPRKRKNVFFLLTASLLLLSIAGYMAWPFLHNLSGDVGPSTLTPIAKSATPVPAGIGFTTAPDGERIGVSDGTYILDTVSGDVSFKEQAAQKLRQGDIESALSLFDKALTQNPTDVEALIYREDLSVLHSRYITIVVGATLSGGVFYGDENDLEGAYVAQKEYNDTAQQHGGIKVRLLIANSGSQAADAFSVGLQINRLAHIDNTIVGVMGWSMTAPAMQSLQLLPMAGIPTVSTAIGDSLTSTSKYFFRVAPPADRQAMVAAQYGMKTLNAKSAAIFTDTSSEESQDLAIDFRRYFVANNGVVVNENYTTANPSRELQLLLAGLQDALHHHVSLIYIPGQPEDIRALLAQMHPSDPPVISATYGSGFYKYLPPDEMSHLHSTTTGYPYFGLPLTPNAPFYTDYTQVFGPLYTSPESGPTMLAYDATQALLQASKIAIHNKYPLTRSTIEQTLTELTGPDAFQGITGQISFGPDDNPINKAVMMMCNKDGTFHVDALEGQFLLGQSVATFYPSISSCASGAVG
jgi:eukaryotic-like serine/threonine-protein kinase